MKQKAEFLKKIFAKYGKAISKSVSFAFSLAALLVWQPAIYKIKSLEIGEYPEEPAEIVRARLQEMRPIILRDAAVLFLLLMVIFFIISLIIWMKRDYNINLIQKLRAKIKKGILF